MLGYVGLLSFGHALYFGSGAYTMALLLIHFKVNIFVGILAGMGIGAIFALMVGLLSIRQYGVYVGIPKAKKTGVHSGFFRIPPISIGMDNPRIDPFLPFCEKSNSLLPTGLTSIISPAPRNVKALSRDKRRSIGGQKKD